MSALRLGTRASALARWQTDHVAAALRERDPGLEIEIVEIASLGDELAEVPIENMEGIGFFTSSLERALLAGTIDAAVHSMKDLPVRGSPELTIAAVPPRGPVEDALCARDRLDLAGLPPGARIGTSSARRTAQVRARRPDVRCVPLRGNVPTRLQRVAAHSLDGVVLARAGLARLGMEGFVTEVFAVETFLPAPAQGAMAVQARRRDEPLRARLAAIDDPATRRAAMAERRVLDALGGGCTVPVGAHARSVNGHLELRAGVFDLDSGRVIRARAAGGDPIHVGEDAARTLLAAGADAILAAFAKRPRLVEER